jgi:plasmid maintenance system antidote protein VapI
MEEITQEEARKLVRNLVDELGTQTAAAEALKVSKTMVSDILSGAREVTDNIAHKLGYKKVVKFVKQDWDVN